MITILNAADSVGNPVSLTINSPESYTLDAQGLTLLPAVIDPHVHFRVPGWQHKEDWMTGAKAAVAGGCTMVFDMPNTAPPTVNAELLIEKKQLIEAQLAQAKIPLRYQLYFGADKQHLNEIAKVKADVVGIKVFMGCSTGNLVIDDADSLEKVFALAAQLDMLVAVHAEDEHLIRARKKLFKDHHNQNFAIHSEIRNTEVATAAIHQAIALTKRYRTKLYILHVSSKDEIDLIRQAKQAQLPVYAETTPHHLFLDTRAYEHLAGKAQVNPPLRDQQEQSHLLAAIKEGVIDTIGSDHAPHTLAEKSAPYGECPSGMPGIEFMLPLLLNAHHQGLLSLAHIINLTSKRAKSIFSIGDYEDWVLVDLNKKKVVNQTESKCGWTPYQGLTLTGWPIFTILKNTLYRI